jgi:hypothetical protein
MSFSSNQKDVGRHLESIAAGTSDGRQRMVFDPETGRLVVADSRQNANLISPDAVVIDSPPRDGFFAR